jgi:microsomal dipeptidase-like Zn-dependent dipeptidase
MTKIIDLMRSQGFNESILQKLCYENWISLAKRVLI